MHNEETFRRGYCHPCDRYVAIGRTPFPVWRAAICASGLILPLLYVGFTTGWFLIGFALWRKSKAVCLECGGENISPKMGSDTEDRLWTAGIILGVLWTLTSGFFWLLDMAAAVQS